MKRVALVLALCLIACLTGFLSSAQCDPNEVQLSAAWIGNAGMTDWSLTNPFSDDTFSPILFTYNYNALLLGASVPFDFGDSGLFVLNGALALPSVAMGQEQTFRRPGNLRYGRFWDADTYHANLEGLYAYAIYGGSSALVGFRWDYWQTSYKNWRDSTNPFILADSDTGDITLNTFLPLVGVKTSVGGLTVGALGFPTTFGTVDGRVNESPDGYELFSGDFDGGYFVEAFLEYNVIADNLFGGLDAAFSLLGKISFLRTESEASLKTFADTSRVWPNDFVCQRNLITLGGKMTLNFSADDLLGAFGTF